MQDAWCESMNDGETVINNLEEIVMPEVVAGQNCLPQTGRFQLLLG